MDRAVATLNKDGLSPTVGGELWIYKANASGFPGSATKINPGGCGTQCVRYTWDAGASKFVTTTAQKNKWVASSIDACPEDRREPERTRLVGDTSPTSTPS